MSTVKTFGLTEEGYIYLQNRSHFERCGKNHSEKFIERLKRNFKTFAYKGYYYIASSDLGGAIGNPENSYEEGRWTHWSVDDMKKMLTEQGIPFGPDGTQEKMSI
jgi:hypothetical protein